MNRLAQEKILNKDDYESLPTYESCLLEKMLKSPFTEKDERASDMLGLIHTDVYGPMSIYSRGGYSYFITFTDDLSRYGYIYLMKHKSESFEMFKQFYWCKNLLTPDELESGMSRSPPGSAKEV